MLLKKLDTKLDKKSLHKTRHKAQMWSDFMISKNAEWIIR